MSTIQLKTKEQINTFIVHLGSSRQEGQIVVKKDSKGNVYYEIPDSYIDESMNAVFYSILDDNNLDAIVVKDFYVICHENVVEQITMHLHVEHSIMPIKFCDMMKEVAAA